MPIRPINVPMATVAAIAYAACGKQPALALESVDYFGLPKPSYRVAQAPSSTCASSNFEELGESQCTLACTGPSIYPFPVASNGFTTRASTINHPESTGCFLTVGGDATGLCAWYNYDGAIFEVSIPFPLIQSLLTPPPSPHRHVVCADTKLNSGEHRSC